MPRETGISLFIDSRKAKTGAKVFERSLDGVRKTARKTVSAVKRGFNGLRSVFGGLRGALAGLGLGLILTGLVSVNKEFERMRGALVTITGSVENANKEFGALQEFAKQTPFTLDQSVNAFIKLQNLGIRPTEELLKSFGNTAAAQGKALNDFIEAVADASTSEFERLKEFGIKASQQGDQVAFTFQGVTTKIKKNSEDIVAFLKDIGDTKFAGAMENQMKRLPGILSNLQDSFSRLSGAIGEGGFTEALGKAALELSNFITEFIESGKAEDIGKVLGAAFELAASGIKTATNLLADFSLGLRGIGAVFSSDPEAFDKLAQEVRARNIKPEPGSGPKIGETLPQVRQQTEAQEAFFEAEEKAAEARKRELELLKERNETIAETLNDLAHERDNLDKLNQAREQGVEAYEAMTAEIEANNIARELGISLYSVEGQHIKSLVTEIQELEKAGSRTWTVLEESLILAVERMGSTLSDFFTTGKLDFASWANSVVSDINRIITQQLFVKPLANAILGAGGGGGLLGSVFGGGGGVSGTAPMETPNISATPIPVGQTMATNKSATPVGGFNGPMNVNVTLRGDGGQLMISDRQVAQEIGENISDAMQRK